MILWIKNTAFAKALSLGLHCDIKLVHQNSVGTDVCSPERKQYFGNRKGLNDFPVNVVQATQEVISKVPLSTEAEFNEAVQSAKSAFPGWSKSSVGTRSRVMFKLQQLLWENKVRLPWPSHCALP